MGVVRHPLILLAVALMTAAAPAWSLPGQPASRLDIRHRLDTAPANQDPTNQEYRDAKACRKLVSDHIKWLEPVGGTITSSIESGRITGDLRGALTFRFRITVSPPKGGQPQTIEWPPTDGSDSSLAAFAGRWAEFRKRAGMTEGRRLDAEAWDTFEISHSCDWKGAALQLADLSHAVFLRNDLSGADLTGASIRETNVVGVNWRDARLIAADLSGTTFGDRNDFTGADFTWASLVDTRFTRGVVLRDANLSFTDLTAAFFEPREITGIQVYGARGLSTLRFNIPTAVVTLRAATREQGLDKETRELSAALFKARAASAPPHVWFFATFVQGGWLTGYGVEPWNAIFVLLMSIPCFAVIYAMTLLKGGRSGLWVIMFTDGAVEKNSRAVRVRLRALQWDGKRRLRSIGRNAARLARVITVGLYFSVLNAFHIGYRELNLGDWISRLQLSAYQLKATGWVRTVAGIQALLSLYLLALWALTYFGNPFNV